MKNKIRIDEYKEMNGLSQRDLAESLGVHQTYISKLLREEKDVFILEKDDGTIEAIEEKKIGNTAA